jgi:HAD superfamily hydrolase (TIGR01509 family)
MIKAIIFDMDGILVDSEPINYKVNRLTFEKIGVKIPKKEFIEEWIIKGTGTREAIKRHNIQTTYEELQKIKKKIYLDVLVKEVKLKPYAKEILVELKKKYKLALASQGHKYNVLAIAKKFGFNRFFDVVLAKQDVNASKPDPEIFLKTAEKLKVKPEECLVIEDSEKGIIAAKKARMKCIAIPDNWTRKYNDFSKADLIIDDLNKLTLDKIQNL